MLANELHEFGVYHVATRLSHQVRWSTVNWLIAVLIDRSLGRDLHAHDTPSWNCYKL